MAVPRIDRLSLSSANLRGAEMKERRAAVFLWACGSEESGGVHLLVVSQTLRTPWGIQGGIQVPCTCGHKVNLKNHLHLLSPQNQGSRCHAPAATHLAFA